MDKKRIHPTPSKFGVARGIANSKKVVLILLPLLTGCVSLDTVFPQIVQNSNSVGDTSANFVGTRAPDVDADGVPDWADQCNDSTAEMYVDPAGCEIVTGVIEGLKFAPDEVELSVESRIVLGKLVDGLVRYPDATFSVEGHTDNRGSAADNLELSKRRVNAVVAFMVEEGITPTQIKPFAFGESRPRAPNETLEGRERNRRIEIDVIERLL